MTDILPSREFRRFVTGKNFMTPDVVRYYGKDKFACELSHGRGLSGDGIYGVTVVEVGKCQRRDLSKPFDSEAEAIAYIEAGLGGDWV